ncbi:MAG: dihydrolipoyl dehydrogenase [Alphaproteobacteria bacterium]|nr:MAG: dihydrolipoyl dehydrogenase [Alphaproteobacteria bacterium]
MDFDLVIIGSGPGGYVAAIRGAQLGLNVAIIEKEALGGICLNWGCIPTKSFLRSAEVLKIIKSSEKYGIKSELGHVDISEIVKRSRSIAKKLSNGVQYLLKKNKVRIFYGEASFKSSKCIKIKSRNNTVQEISGENICIASGGRPREISGISNPNSVWFYKEALQVEKIPNKLLVVGSGAIGVEFASFFAQMGSDVSLLESKPTILPNEDLDVSNFVEKQFLNRGIKIYKNHSLLSFREKGELFEAELKSKDKMLSLEFDKAILAVGIVGNIENLNLEGVNIKVSNGSILVDEFCRTNVDNIYAIGDVASPPWLAHKASHEGISVAEQVAELEVHPIKKDRIPACTYCDPEVASIGLTEKEAVERNIEYKVGMFPFSANGKAMAMGYENGFIKTIIDKGTGEFLGVHMVGMGVTELIHNYALAKEAEIIQENIENTIFPHPTLSEAIHESVLKASDKEIHI